ncbi:MAG: polysaccharide biosynthesis/export family protein [Cyanobacteria bacterium P01_A01_bin.68]
MNKFPFILFIALLFIASCITNRETLNFQENPFSNDSIIRYLNDKATYLLQPGDVLSVQVKSISIKDSELFNLQTDNSMMNINPGALYLSGFSITDSGYIYIPIAGAVKVGGLSVEDARQKIQDEIDNYTSAYVIVSLVSFKVSVIGEVDKPGYFYVYNDRLTLLEALALAGDFKEFADRRRITLVRQHDEGSDVVLLDITDPDIIQSPFFYLEPNDQIYVPQLQIKNSRSNLFNVNTVVGAVSTALTIILLIRNN